MLCVVEYVSSPALSISHWTSISKQELNILLRTGIAMNDRLHGVMNDAIFLVIKGDRNELKPSEMKEEGPMKRKEPVKRAEPIRMGPMMGEICKNKCGQRVSGRPHETIKFMSSFTFVCRHVALL